MAVLGISSSAIGTGFRRQSVIANNLANSVTPGFKSSRADLVTLGGGSGVGVGSITALLEQGPIETTGVPTDLAIEGNGFFALRDGGGRTVYSRSGSFGLDAGGRLVDRASGFAVQGAPQIVLGSSGAAQATGTVTVDGNLNGAGTRAAEGSVLLSAALTDGPAGPPATAATTLTASLGVSVGDTITVTASKGGRALPPASFTVGAGSTLGDLAAFLPGALGINTGGPDILFGATRTTGASTALVGATTGLVQNGTDFTAAGVQVGDVVVFDAGSGAGQRAVVSSISTTGTPNDTLNFAAPLPATLPQPSAGDAYSVHEPPGVSIIGGQIRIAGNVGAANDLSVSVTGTSFTGVRAASGEGAVANALVYDSIGASHPVELTFALESQGPSGNTFRWFGESADNAGGRVTGTGTVSFDTSGRFVAGTGSFTLSIPNAGAATPQTVAADFSGVSGLAGPSQPFLSDQDGRAAGELQGFSIEADGRVRGTFSNGAQQILGSVPLTRFANPGGLTALGGSTFASGPNSGPPISGVAGTIGLGRIRAGALEGSNVDLARELVGQIVNSGFTRANIKMLKVQDEMLGAVLDIKR